MKFKTGYIVVGKDKAKTASRRVVPMTENLIAWLQPHASSTARSGRTVMPIFTEALEPVKTASKVKWKANALRHSFISYRVAEIQNIHQVAQEAGNTPGVIYSSYRELVTPDEAARWFFHQAGNEGCGQSDLPKGGQ